MKNFIPINRKIFKHYLWKEKRVFSKFEAWFDILQMVSYKNGNELLINGILCKWNRGQYPISISFLCERWGWKPKATRNYLKTLKEGKMIGLKRASRWTMLTVSKYDDYNDAGQSEGQSKGNQRDNHGAITGQQLNKDNKENKVNNNSSDDFELFWNSYHRITAKPKTDKEAAEKYWGKLNPKEKELAISNIQRYADSTSEKQYMKKARTYLSDKNFNDEFEKVIKPVESVEPTIQEVKDIRAGKYNLKPIN